MLCSAPPQLQLNRLDIVNSAMAADEALTADVAAGGWIVYAQDKDNEVSFEGALLRAVEVLCRLTQSKHPHDPIHGRLAAEVQTIKS